MILREDGHIPGITNTDPRDLARQASVRASSEWRLEFPEPDNSTNSGTDSDQDLQFPHAQLFPVSGNRVDQVELLLESKLDKAVELRLGLRKAAHVWDFRGSHDLAEARVTVPPRYRGWLAFPLNATVEPERLYYVYTNALPGVHWRMFKETAGEPNRCPAGTTPADRPGPTTWRSLTGGKSLCLKLTPESLAYAATNVIRGTNRPDTWTNIWISDPRQPVSTNPQWIELQWPKVQSFNTIQVTFDTDQNRRVTLPLFMYPDCVKDYRIEYWESGVWRSLASVTDNYARRRVHQFHTLKSERVRLTVLATNGAPSARV